MLKRTLIGAVARAFNPGCKHDTACVIMGDQGAYKSSFWQCLGGPFFSDALR
jgi:predicted P-loop ATPase